jgi:hypothetical protein
MKISDIIQHPRFQDLAVTAVPNTQPDFKGAICAQIGSNIWYFPDEEDPMGKEGYFDVSDDWEIGSANEYLSKVTDNLARVCETCPVLAECFNYAVHHEEWGFWGGTTRNERIRLRHQYKIRLSDPFDSDALDRQIAGDQHVLEESGEWEYYGSSQ